MTQDHNEDSKGKAAVLDRKDYICWIDVETTGIDHTTASLLEVAAILTDLQGNIVSTYNGPTLVAYSADELDALMENSHERVQEMHAQSGLLTDLYSGMDMKTLTEAVSLEELDRSLTAWLEAQGLERRAYVGGNSITLDRNFLEINTPSFFNKLHYRSIDSTTIMLFLGAQGITIPRREGMYTHRAIDDISESVWSYQQSLRAVSADALLSTEQEAEQSQAGV